MDAVNEQLDFAHPENPQISECRHVVLTEPACETRPARAAVAIHPGWLDRSPCGTGTSARMAQLAARGELGLERGLRARLGDRHDVHRAPGGHRRPWADFAAVIPTVRGRAWITGMAHYLLDPDDPFPAGFLLGERP